jgi:non-ribosomal peptide synthetase component F
MTLSHDFWHSQLQGCNLEHPLSLPLDRQRDSTNLRSGLASTAQIIFNDEISLLFLNYASLHNFTLFQLGLATFYTFLFKLTHGEADLCIASINANRYRNELENIIGMFVATLPYRIQLDSRWSFDELVKYVREKCLSILEHSNYPLQHILVDSHINQSDVSFLETMFDFITVSSNVNQFSIEDASLEELSIEQSYAVAKFDFSMIFVCNPAPFNNKLSCSFVCSRDLFEVTAVAQIARRFQYLFEQIFRKKSTDVRMDPIITSINKLSLILPEEAEEIKTAKFSKMEGNFDEGM